MDTGEPAGRAYEIEAAGGCILLRLANFCGASRMMLAKIGALRQPRLRCFVHWTRSARLPAPRRETDLKDRK